MAEIKPITAWRYNPALKEDIDNLTSPLFDVVSDKQLSTLYKNKVNSIHLSVPQLPYPAERARKILAKWRSEGTILQDTAPGIYVYYQYYTLPGQRKEYCRKGFICNIRVYDWDEKVILRHENTIPKAVNDRIRLLEQTQLNVSPTHGLYTDSDFELERYMDESIAAPMYSTENYQGVRDVLSVIQDEHIIEKFVTTVREKQIILADGHHRYEGSLAYRKQRRVQNPSHHGQEGYNFHMMYLSNTEAGDLRILPTHRCIKGLATLKEAEVMDKLSTYFTIKPIADACSVHEVILGKEWAFGLLFKENAYKLRLKPEVLQTMTWNFPDKIKALDVTVMHYFIIEKVLDIKGRSQRSSENITFDRSFSDCLAKVIKEEVQMAIITNEISMDEVKDVCYSGYTMPQKSTYFYPKVICGFLFSALDDKT